MGYQNLTEYVRGLVRTGLLICVDAHLETAGDPALRFTNSNGCRFPMLTNLFVTMTRALFRDILSTIRRLLQAGVSCF